MDVGVSVSLVTACCHAPALSHSVELNAAKKSRKSDQGHDGCSDSAMRRKPEEELDEDMAGAIEDPADDPEVVAQKRDKSEILRKCLTALSPDHREIIDLVYYHEKSVEEVAGIVGIPEATVKTRMFYARKKLSELLKAAGVDRGWP